MASAYERRQQAAARRARRLMLGGALVACFLGVVIFSVWGLGDDGPTTAGQPAAQSAPQVQFAPQVQPAPQTSPAVAVDPVDQRAATLDARALADNFGPLLNAARADEGLGPVTADPLLEQAALNHARDMEARDFFDHVAPDGGTLVDRVTAVGYQYCIVAENIARGQQTLQIVHDAWMNSPGHRRNNLLPGITHYGLVLVDDSWVLVLGATDC